MNISRAFGCVLVLSGAALVGCASVEAPSIGPQSVTVSRAAVCPAGRRFVGGRCEVAPLIEPSAIDTSCPRGMYNDMTQRCVPDVFSTAPIAATQVVSVPAPAAAPPPVVVPRSKHVGPMVRIAAFQKVAAFELDVTEVTVKAYAECVDDGTCKSPATRDDPDLFGRNLHGTCNSGVEKEAHPVNCVSLAQARAYCTWAGKRLPTPDEWLLAAGGGSAARAFPWGANRPDSGEVCVGTEGSCAVGSHPIDTTPDGVMDLGGNVTEWTEDDYPGYSGDSVAMVFVLGGNWLDNDPHVWNMPTRSNTTFVANADEHSALVGFRCAR